MKKPVGIKLLSKIYQITKIYQIYISDGIFVSLRKIHI